MFEDTRRLRRCTVAVFLFMAGSPTVASNAAAPVMPGGIPMLPPVARACVSSPFGPRVLPNKRLAGTFHNGIDLPAAIGSPVVAVAPGTIIRIHRRGVGGLEILIQHNGFIGVYSHLGLITPIFAEGRTAIRGGETIATVGRSGLTYGPHLYFGMIIDGRPIDPAPYLNVIPCGSESAAVQYDRINPTLPIPPH